MPLQIYLFVFFDKFCKLFFIWYTPLLCIVTSVLAIIFSFISCFSVASFVEHLSQVNDSVFCLNRVGFHYLCPLPERDSQLTSPCAVLLAFLTPSWLSSFTVLLIELSKIILAKKTSNGKREERSNQLVTMPVFAFLFSFFIFF